MQTQSSPRRRRVAESFRNGSIVGLCIHIRVGFQGSQRAAPCFCESRLLLDLLCIPRFAS